MTTTTLVRLPLFPLGTVLFPQGFLPLQIFEVRYLDMIGRAHRDGTPFGVVSLIQGGEVEKPGMGPGPGERFHAVGTVARIVAYEAPMPGLMRIQCIGDQRFRVLGPEKLPHGLWVADGESLAEDQRIAIPEDLLHTATTLGRLIKALQSRGLSVEEMPIQPPYELEDCGWVANRWSELLPVPPALKQDLLVQESPVLRLELVSDILARTRLSF